MVRLVGNAVTGAVAGAVAVGLVGLLKFTDAGARIEFRCVVK